MRRTNLFSTALCLMSLSATINVNAAVTGTTTVMQQDMYQGTVKDASGQPIIGASVMVKGTKNGSVTDINGQFSIKGLKAGEVLNITYVGYQPSEVVWQGTPLTITLKDNPKSLNELVVVGYGVQKKANLTGAVDKISSNELGALEVNTMGAALQGQIPNLNVDIADGKPGRAASFNIRGTTSINGGSPLIIIDEVASTAEELNNLSPKDIQDISVLKDAASAAIYGARGSYGVILVTTKKAQAGQFQVNYSNKFGWSKSSRVPELYNGFDYASIINTFAANVGNSYFTTDQVNYFEQAWKDPSQPAGKYVAGGGTLGGTLFGSHLHNYYKEWFRDFTPSQNHHINLLGGSDKFKFFLSGDFNHEEGNIKFKPDQVNRYSVRSNISYDINKHISVFNNTFILHRKDDLANTYVRDWVSNIYRFIEVTNPYVPLSVDINGKDVYTDAGFYKNHVANQAGDVTKLNYFSSTFGVNVNLFDNSLKIHGDFTYKHTDSNRLVWTNWDGDVLYLYSNNNTLATSYPDGTDNISRTMGTLGTTYVNLYATYDKTFGKHHPTIMVGFNREDNSNFSSKGTRPNPLPIGQHSLNLADGTAVINESDAKDAAQSTFFRLNYNYAERYLLEVNGCYNISSKFPRGKRDAMFASVSGGWRVSNEKFFEPLLNVISDLKLRASYGALGNQNINSYDYLSILSLTQTPYTLEGEKVNYTSEPAPKSNNFTWEKAQTVDVGIDFGFLENRLTISADLYQRDTKSMLAKFHSLPSVFGAVVPKENNASLRTRGWEVSLYWQDRFQLSGKEFHYSVRAGLSDYTSKIRDYYNPTNYLDDYYAGQTIGEIWGLTNDGYFKTDAEAQKGPLVETSGFKNYAGAGNTKYKDLNGDGKISKGAWTLADHGDFKVIGNTTPRYLYSLTLSASWSGLDVNAFFRGVGKRDIYPDANSTVFWGPFARKYMVMPEFVGKNVWSEDNQNAYFPRPQAYIATSGNDLNYPQTKYLQNAAYFRMKNLTIGYTLPQEWTRRFRVSKLRIYFSGENLFEFTKLNKAFDPEGLELDPDAYAANVGMGTSYPIQRTYSFGVELQF